MEEEQADRLAQLERQVHDKQITAAAAAKAKASYEAAHLQEVANENFRRAEELAQEAREQAQARNDLEGEGLRIAADALEAASQAATDIRVRHRLQREALSKRQQADDASFKLAQDQLELDRRKAGWTEEVIRTLRAQAEANRNGQKTNETRKLDADQKNDGTKSVSDQIVDYANGFGDLNTQLSDIAKSGIADLSRGLADAIVNAKSLQEAFSNMAKSMIAQLIEMAIRFAIFEAIGMAIGQPGLGKASIGLGKVGRNALGTDSFNGGLTVVGEDGPELMAPARGSQIVPNRLLRQAFSGSAGVAGGTSTTNITNNINATDAVLTDWVRTEVNKGTLQAIAVSQKTTARNMQQKQQNALVRR